MDIYDLWFSSVKISNKIKNSILKKFKSTRQIYIHSIYNDNSVFLGENCGKICGEFKKAWNKYELESLMEYSLKKGIDTVNCCDKNYPARLKNYDDSPAILFYRGDIERLKQVSVGMVGARNCSLYGRNVASLLGKEVSSNNVNIISGMARGIDSCCHRAAVENDGYTCAVLGSGLDVIYPRENAKLYDGILENGCILSEFMPKTKPYSYNFPMRNRIISGLSDLVIVIEAGNKSGALITAGCALEQGKDVMAVPGSIFSPQSKGTNTLIREGAHVFTCLEDLFQMLPVRYMKERYAKESTLNATQEKICKLIGHIPMHIDEICRITNIDIKRLYELLFELQLNGKIICLQGNYYVNVKCSKDVMN
ncbi:DNA-processing protein DprA [Clostridium luticellarii]|nr:DNA-processing protein DprA [Clostridium luticellarii]MCI1943898.1 DNA-processing protein DprA [Clostridium luticellarii]MCI1967159.1 DNA-processing protein DprA [Clostridium luticellarii]MCI1994526.1 DNA-processing protein DprA [Clostridium luticellarii]MCI2038521.1 DNA-processing protein DprA [Clostridium luticellarii]